MGTTPTTSSPSAESATSSRSDGRLGLGLRLGHWPWPWRSPLPWQSYVLVVSLVGIGVAIGGWLGLLAASALGAVLLPWGARNGVFSPAAAMGGAEQDRERDRLETVLSSTLEGVIALDEEGRVSLMNQAAQRLLSVSPEVTLGRLLGEALGSQTLVDLARQAVATGSLLTMELKEPGKVLEVHAAPLKAGQGAVLLVQDLTEVRRLESVRRDFVANVSHELKTPLTSIRAYLETLLEGGALSDAEHNVRFLTKIEAHVHRLSTLITDLLSLSRIEAGDAFNQRLRCNLNELVMASYQRLGPSAEQKNLALRIQLAEEPLHAVGDTEAFNQIFDNLIDNAIKYTEPGGSVDVTVKREEKRVRVDVADTGVGIPAEDLPRIFERFYRVDKARSRELGGTGLGLSIVKHLVQALDAEIHVESKVGAGSTFTVAFAEA